MGLKCQHISWCGDSELKFECRLCSEEAVSDLRRVLADSQAREAAIVAALKSPKVLSFDGWVQGYLKEFLSAATQSAADAFVADVRAKARNEGLQTAAQLLLDGRFLHDEAPGARLAREAAQAICDLIEGRHVIVGNVCRSDRTEGLKLK